MSLSEGYPGDDGDSSGNDGMMMGMVVEIVTLMGEEGLIVVTMLVTLVMTIAVILLFQSTVHVYSAAALHTQRDQQGCMHLTLCNCSQHTRNSHYANKPAVHGQP